jgi:hypothetical protein
VIAYDPDGKNLGKLEVKSPRAGWHEFAPVAGARTYVSAATRKE